LCKLNIASSKFSSINRPKGFLVCKIDKTAAMFTASLQRTDINVFISVSRFKKTVKIMHKAMVNGPLCLRHGVRGEGTMR